MAWARSGNAHSVVASPSTKGSRPGKRGAATATSQTPTKLLFPSGGQKRAGASSAKEKAPEPPASHLWRLADQEDAKDLRLTRDAVGATIRHIAETGSEDRNHLSAEVEHTAPKQTSGSCSRGRDPCWPLESGSNARSSSME